MSLKSFINPSIKWVPQSNFSVAYTENGGIEASQDVLLRNVNISTVTEFRRGTRWEVIFPEVPEIYRTLTMKTFDPQDRGDGWSIIKCTFTGYQFTGNGSSGEEDSVATTTLTGQLNAEALSSHPKWETLTSDEKWALGKFIAGDFVAASDFSSVGTHEEYDYRLNYYTAIDNNGANITFSENAVQFIKIIAEGESTWDRGGWTYSYHTESAKGFTASQLNSLGKIVSKPPGDPVKPSKGWTWQLTSPNQSQSGQDRFMKTLDFRLIRDNEKNQFLYGE
jgi:hypothetical protein